jgi:hypothetical protein
MMTGLLVMLTLAHIPLPQEGAERLPALVKAAEALQSDQDALARIEHLRRSFCAGTYHVTLVNDPERASAVFEVSAYDVIPLPDGRQRHRIEGRYQLNDKWEPFRSWADSGRFGPPSRLGRFVETSLFGEAYSADEVRHATDRGRGNPGCAAEQ